MSRIILIGAGALARDLIDCFGAATFAGIYVDPRYAANSLSDLPVYTDWDSVGKLASYFVLGVSDIAHRERAKKDAMHAGLLPPSPLVAQTAVVAADACLAPGVMIGHMVVVGPTARLEENALVMHSVIVGHDSVVGAGAVLCAGACIGGNVHIGDRTFVGTNAVLAPRVKVGEDTYIAAGAACFRDTEPGSRWIGNPARRNGVARGKN